MIASGMNLISTIIGFGISATFIVFVCTRIICGRIRGAESRQMFIESRIDLEQPEHRITGLEPVLVAAIPTMMFGHEAFGSAEDPQCSICLGEYQEKEGGITDHATMWSQLPSFLHRLMAEETVYMSCLSIPSAGRNKIH